MTVTSETLAEYEMDHCRVILGDMALAHRVFLSGNSGFEAAYIKLRREVRLLLMFAGLAQIAAMFTESCLNAYEGTKH